MNENVPKWLIPGRVYDVLKWVGLLVLPTCAWLFGTVGPAWGWENVDAVVLTLNAAGTAIGAVIGASAISAWKGGADEE
ncbi:MAG: phage holin [Senegalimassilia anaerobia]|nr:phage holin [Senegalimassilia anaerobia]